MRNRINKCYHVTSKSNLLSIMRDGLHPNIPQDFGKNGDLCGVYLFKSYEDCECALLNWFGERIDDIEDETGVKYEEIILEIDASGLDLFDSAGFEYTCLEKIMPNRITLYTNK